MRTHSSPRSATSSSTPLPIAGWGSHPLGDEMHRWIAVTGDDQVVGHLAATPQYYRINEQRVVAHTPCDYMVNPRHGFQALSLMRAFLRATRNCVACDMVPAVMEVESRLGAEVAGQLQYAVKLLNVSRLPTPSLPALALRPRLSPVPRDRSAREGRRDPTWLLHCAYGDLDRPRRYILDLDTLPAHRDVLRTLLRESVRFFRRVGVQMIRSGSVNPRVHPGRVICGVWASFLPQGEAQQPSGRPATSLAGRTLRAMVKGASGQGERYTEDHGR